MYGLVGYEPLTYEDYTYPAWANVLGWFIAGSSVAMIPGVAAFKLLTTPGTFWQVTRNVAVELISFWRNRKVRRVPSPSFTGPRVGRARETNATLAIKNSKNGCVFDEVRNYFWVHLVFRPTSQ